MVTRLSDFWAMEVVIEKFDERSISMIKKDKDGYKVVSKKGKNLGSGYKTREAAAKRLRQVEFFKRKKG